MHENPIFSHTYEDNSTWKNYNILKDINPYALLTRKIYNFQHPKSVACATSVPTGFWQNILSIFRSRPNFCAAKKETSVAQKPKKTLVIRYSGYEECHAPRLQCKCKLNVLFKKNPKVLTKACLFVLNFLIVSS